MLVFHHVLAVSSTTSSAAHSILDHLEILAQSSATFDTLPITFVAFHRFLVHLNNHQTNSNHFQTHFNASGLFNNWNTVCADVCLESLFSSIAVSHELTRFIS